jgi:hypothetical protein
MEGRPRAAYDLIDTAMRTYDELYNPPARAPLGVQVAAFKASPAKRQVRRRRTAELD